MAPLTRAHRARAEIIGEEIEPLSPALTTNTLTPTRHTAYNHLRFDDEEDTPVTRCGGIDVDDAITYINDHQVDEVADSQNGSDSDSDDDAPEAVSMGAGKEEAEKREEETMKAAEARKEAARKKRKERDSKLKEQKAEASARKESKRRKLDDAESAIASQLTREATASEKVGYEPAGTTFGKHKPPLLLPESLLAQVSAHPELTDDDESSDEDIESAALAPVVSSTRLDKNRRRRELKKRNKVLKKGVVNVKVLNNEAASKKAMAPPVSKRVGNVKEAWLFSRMRGRIERRIIGGGFIKKK